MKKEKYQIVYADPPWNQRKGGLRNVRPNQKRKLDYPTLALKEIKEILSDFQGDVLFLWTIDKFLFEAQKIGEELGYKLHDRIVWDKENGIAPAFTIRFSKEYLLWMYKSPMLKIAPEVRGKFTDVIREKATKHSKKPIKAYKLIEALYPLQSKIELFARSKRRGWDAWGSWLSASAPYINSPFEGILIMYKKDWKKHSQGKSTITKEDFIDLTRGIWNLNTESRGLTKANFPVDLPEKCIGLLSYEDNVVLDPFMGAGTVAEACLRTNRKYIGFEISEKYCKIMQCRTNQTRLTEVSGNSSHN